MKQHQHEKLHSVVLINNIAQNVLQVNVIKKDGVDQQLGYNTMKMNSIPL
jgi:hypothetical protein